MQSRDTISNYCERLGPGFWDEPLNAVTNLAFAIAAIAAWILVQRAGPGPCRWSVRALPVLIFLIFLGSAAFHTTATRWGAIADTGFIAIYLLYYIVLFVTLFWSAPWRMAWLAAPVFIGFTILIALGADLVGLDGPGMYLSALIALLGLGGSLSWSKLPEVRPYGRRYLVIGLLFAVSLTFRTVDRTVCDSISVGTHFLWHVLNAGVLFLTAQLAVRRWREISKRDA